jgi:hypothetical protein
VFSEQLEGAITMETQKVTVYFVNGEQQETVEHKLTAREVLFNAGFRPPEQYRLVRDEGNYTYPSLDSEVEVHKDERFTALFQGPTPVS